MTEKQDIAMNQFQIVSDAPYVYVELADGSQGKIKKSDLIELIRANMPLATQTMNGLMSAKGIINKGNIKENDLLSVGSSFGYSFADDGSGLYGVYLSLEGVLGYIFQLKVSNDATALKFRTFSATNNEWSSWKSISFT